MADPAGERRSFLLELVPAGAVCAEIGVWDGDFAALILDVVGPSQLHLVDPWQFMSTEPYAKARYGGGKARSQADMDQLYESVVQRFAAPIADGTVHLHRSTSENAVAGFPDGSLDFVYVDGNHLYDHVRRDLELYFPKVRSGGLIAGDDYGKTGWWADGVTRAVDEFVSASEAQLLSTKRSQFVLRKPG
jgi:hypothetical protein